jgi:hypothetical protein
MTARVGPHDNDELDPLVRPPLILVHLRLPFARRTPGIRMPSARPTSPATDRPQSVSRQQRSTTRRSVVTSSSVDIARMPLGAGLNGRSEGVAKNTSAVQSFALQAAPRPATPTPAGTRSQLGARWGFGANLPRRALCGVLPPALINKPPRSQEYGRGPKRSRHGQPMRS